MARTLEFKQSRETQIIYELFKTIADRDDAIVTFDEMCEATGKPREHIRGAIHTALNKALRVDGLPIENDRGLGYRLRQDPELAGSGQKAIDRSRKIQNVGLLKLNTVRIEKLTAEEKTDFYVKKTVLEMLMAQSRPRTMSNVTQMIMRKHNELDHQEMLQAVRDSLNASRR